MSATYYFLHKELLESWRTHRTLILAVVFLIFGILSPLTAKLTPEIVKMSMQGQISIKLPQPTSLDSWQQFYKNITQMGIYVFAIIFGNSVSQEVNRGTLINLVTKGMPRFAAIFAKMISILLQWVVCIGLCFGVCWAYTAYYFPDGKSEHVWLAVLPLLLFGFFFVSLILFGSTIANNNYGGFLLAVIVMALLSLLNIAKSVRNYNPVALTNNNLSILTNANHLNKIIPAMIVSVVIGGLLLIASVKVLQKKKL